MSYRDDYKKMANALVDARAVVLSLLKQLGINGRINKEQLRAIVRQAALDIVARQMRPIGRKPRGPNRRRVS